MNFAAGVSTPASKASALWLWNVPGTIPSALWRIMITPKKERILLPPERKRSKQLKIWISQEEQDMIRQKMAEFGTDNMGAFVRKMVIDGYILKLDLPELREVSRHIGYLDNNINQMARKVNAGKTVYKEDVDEIQAQFNTICKLQRKIIRQLSKLN